MTVQSQTSFIGYDGPGSVFAIPFRFLSDTDIRITKALADGTSETLVLTTDYTLVGARQQSGGTATLVVALLADERIVIDRGNMQLTQLTDYRANDPFPEEAAEDIADRQVMLLQQGLLDGSARSLRLSPVDIDGSGTYQGNGNRIANIADAVDAGDVPNLAQVNGLISIPSGPFLQAGSGAVGRTVQDKLRDTVSLKDFGSFGDGVLFDDLPFQRAIAFASSTCRDVLIPAGTYRLAATVQVPAGVNLIGEGAKPYTGPNSVTATPGAGSWLHFDHAGIGIQFVGATAASSASGLKSCGTMRTHDAPGVGWTPEVYDYDIDVQGVETFIDDVCLLNAYKGIRLINSGYGRLWTSRVRGQCFAEGINLEQSFDTSHIRDTHFWPYWSQQADVIAWQQANLKVLRIARSDNTQVGGLFSIYSNVGLEIYGTADGTAYRNRFTDVEFDSTTYGIRVLSSSDGASIFTANFGAFGPSGSTTSRGIWIEGDNARYEMTNMDLSLFGLDGVRIDGTGNTMDLVNARVRSYNQAAVGASAYEVAAGNLLEFADRPKAEGGGAGPLFGAVAGVYKAHLGGGLVGGTTDGSGDYTVTHGLGTSPIVQVSGIANGSNRVALKSQGATTFVVTLYNAAGTPQAATALNFNWEAFKH